MGQTMKVSRDSLVLGFSIDQPIIATQIDELYNEYEDFVGDSLNQFYDYVIEHPNQVEINFKLDLF